MSNVSDPKHFIQSHDNEYVVQTTIKYHKFTHQALLIDALAVWMSLLT